MTDMQTLLWAVNGALGVSFIAYALDEYVSHKRLTTVLNEYRTVRDFHSLSEARFEDLIDKYVTKLNKLHLFSRARQERDSAIYHMTRHRQKEVTPEALVISYPDGTTQTVEL